MAIEITAKTIEDLMIVSSVSNEGRDAYGNLNALFEFEPLPPRHWEREYYKNVYSDPFFFKEKKFWERIKEENEEEEKNVTKKHQEEEMGIKLKKYENFELRFYGHNCQNMLSVPLYIITGTVGSGKTNYVHKLIYYAERDERHVDDQPYIHCLREDFEVAPQQSVLFLEKDYIVAERNPLNSLELILIKNMGLCLTGHFYCKDFGWKYRPLSIKEIKLKIKIIDDVYKEYFANSEHGLDDEYEFKMFFNELYKKSQNAGTIDEFVENIFIYIRNVIIDNKKGKDYQEEREKSLMYLTEILLRLFFVSLAL